MVLKLLWNFGWDLNFFFKIFRMKRKTMNPKVFSGTQKHRRSVAEVLAAGSSSSCLWPCSLQEWPCSGVSCCGSSTRPWTTTHPSFSKHNPLLGAIQVYKILIQGAVMNDVTQIWSCTYALCFVLLLVVTTTSSTTFCFTRKARTLLNHVIYVTERSRSWNGDVRLRRGYLSRC